MRKLAALLTIAFLVSAFSYAPAHGDDSSIVILINNKVRQPVTKAFLRSAYGLNAQQWNDGIPIVVVTMQPSDPLTTKFCTEVLGIYPYQLERAWDRKLFAGLAIRPISVTSSKEMLSVIASTPGAIGFGDGSIIAGPLAGISVVTP